MASRKGLFDRLGIRRKPTGADELARIRESVDSLDASVFEGLEDFYGRFLNHFSRSEYLDRRNGPGQEIDPEIFMEAVGTVMSYIRSWKNGDLVEFDIRNHMEQVFVNDDVDINLEKNKVYIDKLVELLDFINVNSSSISQIVNQDVAGFRLAPEYLQKIADLNVYKLTMNVRLEHMESSLEEHIRGRVLAQFAKDGVPAYHHGEFSERIMGRFKDEAGKGIESYLDSLSRYVPLTHPMLVRESGEMFNIYREYFLDVFRSGETSRMDKAKNLWNLVRVARVIINNEHVARFERMINQDQAIRNYAAVITFYLSTTLYYCLVESIYSSMSDMLKNPSQ